MESPRQVESPRTKISNGTRKKSSRIDSKDTKMVYYKKFDGKKKHEKSAEPRKKVSENKPKTSKIVERKQKKSSILRRRHSKPIFKPSLTAVRTSSSGNISSPNGKKVSNIVPRKKGFTCKLDKHAKAKSNIIKRTKSDTIERKTPTKESLENLRESPAKDHHMASTNDVENVEEERSNEVFDRLFKLKPLDQKEAAKIREKIVKKRLSRTPSFEERDTVFYPRTPPTRNDMELRLSEKYITEQKKEAMRKSVYLSYRPSEDVETNNTNDGHLFVDGPNGTKVPFWFSAIAKETEKGKADDDECPALSSQTFMDALMGNITIVEVPDDVVRLNAYASVAELESRDSLFFTQDIIFCNSLRNMLNMQDDQKKDMGNERVNESNEYSRGMPRSETETKSKGIALETSLMMGSPIAPRATNESFYYISTVQICQPYNMMYYTMDGTKITTRCATFSPSGIRLNSRA